MVEIKRRLSWVDFLAPLSEEQLDDLLLRAGFVRLKEGEELVIGPEEQAERMLLLVAGQLQVYVMSPSERELTLSVLASGSVVASTGLVPRWARDLHIRALEASVVCRVEREDLEALVRTNPEVGLRLARMLATRVMLMEDRWADMAEKEVRERLDACCVDSVRDRKGAINSLPSRRSERWPTPTIPDASLGRKRL